MHGWQLPTWNEGPPVPCPAQRTDHREKEEGRPKRPSSCELGWQRLLHHHRLADALAIVLQEQRVAALG
jgi:hypothetical protein